MVKVKLMLFILFITLPTFVFGTNSASPTINIIDCIEIKKETDKFTNEIKLYSPIIIKGSFAPLRIIKIIAGNTKYYFLSLTTKGFGLNVGKSGVILLFEDGSKLHKNDQVDVKVGSKGSYQ